MKGSSQTLRTVTAVAVMLVVAVGFFTHFGIGTLSAPGIQAVSLLCPLGALTSMIAAKTLIPQAVISLVVVAALVIVFARAFCGWLCPVPVLQKAKGLFRRHPAQAKGSPVEKAEEENGTQGESASAAAPLSAKERRALSLGCKSSSGCASCAKKRGEALDARHFVLGGTVLSAAIFGFPVFCLVCPIGLTFAAILLFINLFAHGDVSWGVVVVPALLAVEVLVLRKWCHNLCPLSALMSLVGKANRTFVPTIDDGACLETADGVACGACGRACAEGIDIRHPELSTAAMSECTKCRACVDACPRQAVTMPFLARRSASDDNPVMLDEEACEKGVIGG